MERPTLKISKKKKSGLLSIRNHTSLSLRQKTEKKETLARADPLRQPTNPNVTDKECHSTSTPRSMASVFYGSILSFSCKWGFLLFFRESAISPYAGHYGSSPFSSKNDTT